MDPEQRQCTSQEASHESHAIFCTKEFLFKSPMKRPQLPGSRPPGGFTPGPAFHAGGTAGRFRGSCPGNFGILWGSPVLEMFQKKTKLSPTRIVTIRS